MSSSVACVYRSAYTLGMSKTVPVRELRADLAELLDDVADRREHIIVTRRGKRAAVIVPVDEYDALEETAEILSDPGAMEDIKRSRADFRAGRTHTLDEVRADLAKRRRK